MDIEKLATSAVEDAIAKTDFLSPFVNSGDKEPFWDGHIYAFSHKSKKNKYYKGRAPVQVKGKLCKNFSGAKFQYPVKTVDLRSYRKEGGTIYFVIQINDDGTCKKIYYNVLLPYLLPDLDRQAAPLDPEVVRKLLSVIRDFKRVFPSLLGLEQQVSQQLFFG